VSFFIAQLHTVAQIDSDQWINFLILAVMAVLWLFGALIKAATKRKPPQTQGGPAGQQRESWQQRLARKAEELQRALEGQSTDATERIRRRLEERARMQQQTHEAPPGKVTVRSGKGGESVMVYERAESAAEPKLEAPEPTLRSAAEEPEDVTLHLPQPSEPGKEGPETRREPVAGYDPASVIDYTDPDALRKAILHYEILGKPVGMRDPSDQLSAF